MSDPAALGGGVEAPGVTALLRGPPALPPVSASCGGLDPASARHPDDGDRSSAILLVAAADVPR